MHHTIQEIIDNQNDFKEEILAWFGEDLKKTKKELNEIQSRNQFIQNEKIKLIKKFDKTNFNKFFSKLFFMHSSRNKDFYVWWDKDNHEAHILKYDKN